jgi:alkylation response protein AidB-like acyl-CoA dehydrogenase
VDLTLNDEQQALRAGLREYLAGRWTADRLRAAASDSAPGGGAAWKELAGLGVFGLIAPAAVGGLALSLADAAIACEELGAALVPGPLVPSILAAGLVDGAADGDAVVTMLDTAGGVPLLEHPGIATHVIVVDAAGLFLRPRSAVAAAPAATPLDPLTPVALVPDGDQPHGERIGTAADAADWRLRGTVLTAALQVGVARGGLDLAVRYARERMQFGRLIGSFQAVKHLLANARVKLEFARPATYRAAWSLTTAQPTVSHDASMAKAMASDAADVAARVALQVHGAIGYTWECDLHFFMKRTWALSRAWGDAPTHRRLVLAQARAGQ